MERKDAKVEKEEAEKYRHLQTEIVSTHSLVTVPATSAEVSTASTLPSS